MRNVMLFILGLLLMGCKPNQNSVQAEEVLAGQTAGDEQQNEEPAVNMNAPKEMSFENVSVKAYLVADTLFITRKKGADSAVMKRITISSEEGDYFEGFKFFRYKGNVFFQTQITQMGTGYFNYDYLYVLDTVDLDMLEVDIRYASDVFAKSLDEDEGVWKGEGRIYGEDEIIAGFYIWNDTDANCCPSVGEVTARYIIEKIDAAWVMHQDTFFVTRY